jgi:pimeloyl-ACP methyl ester carboxylesterase
MGSRGGQGRFWAGLVLSVCLLSGAGCVHFDEVPPPEYPADFLQPQGVPEACRNRVHIFIVQGADPLDLAGVKGLRKQLIDKGFLKVYHGYPYHYFYFCKLIRQLHYRDPDARFVLIGHRLGAAVVEKMARSLADEEVPVELLVYLDGVFVGDPDELPPPSCRVVNMQPSNPIGHQVFLTNAENFENVEAHSLNLLTHHDTLPFLINELALVASHVPLVFPGLPPGQGEPHPVASEEAAEPWNFLQAHPLGPNLDAVIPRPWQVHEDAPRLE